MNGSTAATFCALEAAVSDYGGRSQPNSLGSWGTMSGSRDRQIRQVNPRFFHVLLTRAWIVSRGQGSGELSKRKDTTTLSFGCQYRGEWRTSGVETLLKKRIETRRRLAQRFIHHAAICRGLSWATHGRLAHAPRSIHGRRME